jgi:hypothetical protein
MPTRHSHPIPLLRLPEGLSYKGLDIEALCHRLGAITQPTLVANEDNDTMMSTASSTSTPNFADHVNAFLNGG